MMHSAVATRIGHLRQIVRAAWNWWTAIGLVIVLAVAAAPRHANYPGSSSVVAFKLAPITTTGNDALTPLEPAGAPAQPKLKLNAPKSEVAPAANAVAIARRSSPGHTRQMARKASLSILVSDVGRAVSSLTAVSRAFDGDVTKLADQRPASPDERREANLTLVVPSDHFDAALARIATIGGVRSQDVAAEDVGDQIVDDAARLRNLRRTEIDLLKIMDRSGRVSDILGVENQLSDVREQIEKLDAEAQALKARVATSTIDVHLEEEARTLGAEPNAVSQLSNAWAAAWHASREAALGLVARLFFLIAFAPFWLAILGIVALAVAQTRRRLRGQTA